MEIYSNGNLYATVKAVLLISRTNFPMLGRAVLFKNFFCPSVVNHYIV